MNPQRIRENPPRMTETEFSASHVGESVETIFLILRNVALTHQKVAESLSFLLQKKENAQGKTPKENSLQLCSFHTLARLCSKSFMLGFSSMRTENFQMYKLGLEKAEEPEIKLPIFIGSQRKQGNSRKTSTSASLTTQKPLCGSQQTVENSLRDGNTRPPYVLPVKPVCSSRNNSQKQTWNNRLASNLEKIMSKLYIVTLLI